MRSRHPLRARCQVRPFFEDLEGRDLLSTLAAASAGSFPDPRVIEQVASDIFPASAPPGTPTATEIRRQTVTARWVGKYTIGPPRFSDRASTIHVYGVSGGSNQFLKGKTQISIFPPADPAATPTPGNLFANQITGEAALFGQSYLQSGAVLVLDLNGTPVPGSSPGALPTSLNWAYDSNTSGGPFAAPGGIVPGSGYTRGAGLLQLQWKPDPHPLRGTSGSGQVIVTFQGLINTSQLVSGVSKYIS